MVGPGGLLKTAFAVLPLRASVLNARPLAFVEPQSALSPSLNPQTKNPRRCEGFYLVGPGGFEPPTSTMSR